MVLGGDGMRARILTRLRTEVVDVDAKGNKCRERQTTECGTASQVPGQDPVPEFDGEVKTRRRRRRVGGALGEV